MAQIELPTKTVQDQIKTKVDAIDGNVTTLLSKGNSVIKSIQKGEQLGNGNSNGVTVKYTSIVPEKTMVLINGNISRESDTAYATNITSTSMLIKPNRTGATWATNVTVTWQLIEFY